MKARAKADWTRTPEGDAKYHAARAEAQAAANEDGADRGIERSDFDRSFRVFRLPQARHRYGHELRCEVVSCETLEKCQPGHGPLMKRNG